MLSITDKPPDPNCNHCAYDETFVCRCGAPVKLVGFRYIVDWDRVSIEAGGKCRLIRGTQKGKIVGGRYNK